MLWDTPARAKGFAQALDAFGAALLRRQGETGATTEAKRVEMLATRLTEEKAVHERTKEELAATQWELAIKREDYAGLAATHEAVCAELESLRKPLEGELAEDVALVRNCLPSGRPAINGRDANSALDRIELALSGKR